MRKLESGGTWNTLAGQPSDDSELALSLAHVLVDNNTYNAESALEAYTFWLKSDPFDCGNTIHSALLGEPNLGSQANGALMRVSPLGIFGARHSPEQVAEWARKDAALTHPNAVCQDANALFAMAIAHAMQHAPRPEHLYAQILNWSEEMHVTDSLKAVLHASADTPPDDYCTMQGWVLIALQNALWQLLHAPSFEAGVVDTIMRGGDTDTNAAICGALLGAIYGIGAVPKQWTEAVLSCRPQQGAHGVYRPRPECFWPTGALELATRLAGCED